MIRQLFMAAILQCCSGLIAAQPLRAEPTVAPGSVCFYRGKSYSEGAFICVQKSLMQSCATDGTRAAWTIVADKDLSARCVASTALDYPPAPRRHPPRMHAYHHSREPEKQAAAKCFSFNGKQYCE